jgi:ribosomal protein S18 acetylase RimI-like enzyme
MSWPEDVAAGTVAIIGPSLGQSGRVRQVAICGAKVLGVLKMRPASPADVPAIYRLRTEAELWLAERRIRQWPVGEARLDVIADQVARGDWHVTGDGGAVEAGLRLLWADAAIWPDDGVRAVYVHGLMIDHRLAGTGLGARLLDWAAEAGRRSGAAVMRLDCIEGNERLLRYYLDLGFREVGRRDLDRPFFSTVLLEK